MAPSVHHVSPCPRTVLGEGPHWDSVSNVLYYVDIKGGEVHRYCPRTKTDTSVDVDGGPVSFVVPVQGSDHHFAVGVGRDVCVVAWDGVARLPGRMRRVATVDDVDGKRDNRINDGKADPGGRLWAGTMGREERPCQFVPANGCLFSVGADGAVATHVTGITCSNGMAWSDDGAVMYYTDSGTRNVDAFDFDVRHGTISNRRTVFDFNQNTVEGFPDGMTIDTDGNLWVACFNGSKVVHIDPRTGQLLASIPVPSPKVTSVTFGGIDLHDLYVTSASVDMSEEALAAAPQAGCTFVVTGTGTRGNPAQRVVLEERFL